MRKLSVVIGRVACGMALAWTASAGAGTSTGSFQVTATVMSSCTVSGGALSFGTTLDPLASSVPIDTSSTLTVQCTNTTPYTLSLTAGVNAGGASLYSARAMKSGVRLLPYQLYLDAGHATVWGDGTTSSSTQGGTGTGGSQSVTIYGRIPSLTNIVPGSYADTVTVTISY